MTDTELHLRDAAEARETHAATVRDPGHTADALGLSCLGAVLLVVVAVVGWWLLMALGGR